jgi:hypothetical protein
MGVELEPVTSRFNLTIKLSAHQRLVFLAGMIRLLAEFVPPHRTSNLGGPTK